MGRRCCFCKHCQKPGATDGRQKLPFSSPPGSILLWEASAQAALGASIFALQERRRSKKCTNLEAHALQLAALASSDTGSGRSLADLLAAPQRRG